MGGSPAALAAGMTWFLIHPSHASCDAPALDDLEATRDGYSSMGDEAFRLFDFLQHPHRHPFGLFSSYSRHLRSNHDRHVVLPPCEQAPFDL
jgi:hypothetical protein